MRRMFITIEGPEGSGKTTVAKRVVETLENQGYKVMYTREPGGVGIAEKIRDIILDVNNTNLDPRSEALLYAASRRQHLVEKVWPNVKEGKLVICDRYLDSSLAYQGYARGLGVEDILNVNMYATEGTFPDLTLLFDLEPEVGLARINANSDREVNRLDLEKLSFHHRVRNGYLSLAKRFPDRFVIIDASKDLEEVAASALKAIKERLNK